MRKVIVIIILITTALLLQGQNRNIRTLSAASLDTPFSYSLPAGTYVYDIYSQIPYHLTMPAGASLTLREASKVKLLTGNDLLSVLDSINQHRVAINQFSSNKSEIEITSDNENSFNVGFILSENNMVYYNGVAIQSQYWTGVGTSVITMQFNTKQFDNLIIHQ